MDTRPGTHGKTSGSVGGGLVRRHGLLGDLGLIEKASQIEALVSLVSDNGDVYCVPAFSGLFAPYWRSDARKIIAGLSRYANKSHITRAALEATAFQTRNIVEAMNLDSSGPVPLQLKRSFP